jgi:hypothetical protein
MQQSAGSWIAPLFRRDYCGDMNRSLPPLPRARRFRSLMDADETLTFEMKPWFKSLSRAEDNALRNYKEAFGRQINFALLEATGTDKILLHQAKTLATALDKAVLPFTVRTFRAAGPQELRTFKAMALNETQVSKTFISTSLHDSVARAIAASESRTVIQIIVAAGTKGAAYIHPFPDYEHEEFEILLNVGTKLRSLRNDDIRLVLLAGDLDEGDDR